jgi:hypothetical protein
MSSSSNIDIPGLLRNSLNGGVGILAAILRAYADAFGIVEPGE